MDLVTVALQVSHEYRLCWKIAAQRELSYSARKQTKPFITGEFPGHLSLLSYLYSFLKRKSNTALCLRSKSSSIAGFSSPDAGLQPQSHSQKGLCGEGFPALGFPHHITLCIPNSSAEDEKFWAPHQPLYFCSLAPSFCIPSPSAQLGQDC